MKSTFEYSKKFRFFLEENKTELIFFLPLRLSVRSKADYLLMVPRAVYACIYYNVLQFFSKDIWNIQGSVANVFTLTTESN